MRVGELRQLLDKLDDDEELDVSLFVKSTDRVLMET